MIKYIKTIDYPSFYYKWVTRGGHKIVSCKLVGGDYIVKVAL